MYCTSLLAACRRAAANPASLARPALRWLRKLDQVGHIHPPLGGLAFGVVGFLGFGCHIGRSWFLVFGFSLLAHLQLLEGSGDQPFLVEVGASAPGVWEVGVSPLPKYSARVLLDPMSQPPGSSTKDCSLLGCAFRANGVADECSVRRAECPMAARGIKPLAAGVALPYFDGVLFPHQKGGRHGERGSDD